MKTLRHILWTLMLVTLLCSCEHKELCYRHPHWTKLRIAFDFSRLPEGKQSPVSMRVVLYPDAGGESIVYDFAGGRSAVVEVPDGGYRAVCYNVDVEYIDFTGTTFDGFTAVTDSKTAPDGSAAFDTPDWLIASSLDNIVVKAALGEEQVITFYPTERVCQYTFEVRGMQHTERIVDMRATLGGMAAKHLVAADALPSGSDDCLLVARATLVDGVAKGGFYTFGHSPAAGTPNRFVLYVQNEAGKVQTVEADVTSQVWAVPLVGHLADVHIIVTTDITIDDKKGGGGSSAGFDVDVDNWEDINQEIIVN